MSQSILNCQWLSSRVARDRRGMGERIFDGRQAAVGVVAYVVTWPSGS